MSKREVHVCEKCGKSYNSQEYAEACCTHACANCQNPLDCDCGNSHGCSYCSDCNVETVTNIRYQRALDRGYHGK